MGGIGPIEVLLLVFISGLVLVPIVGVGVLIYFLVHRQSGHDSTDRPESKDR
jgi:hypothetical protein